MDNQPNQSAENNIGKINLVQISDEMRKSYLDYAMSVIVARALPDARDGLKPVHRRILYTMFRMGLSHTARFTKSAKVVGETMGKFHPHGDMAIYDTIVRLAQDFAMRYPLVAGQGNFGSIDGDSPAAMRYTEVKLAKIAKEMLEDIDKETVEFVDNFDGTLKEPLTLPTKVPNLLLMGSDGIAVGMATKIPPHNLTEVIDATLLLIKKGRAILPENEQLELKKISFDEDRLESIGDFTKKAVSATFDSNITIEQLLETIKGPDFPTGGTIYDQEAITQAYASGRGKIDVRGEATIEETKNERFRIVVKEIPYQVNKSAMVARIAQLIRDKKITGISDLRDESDRHGLRVVMELKRGVKPKSILNSLFKHTALQSSFPVNMVALVDGVPQTMNLKQMLCEFVRHRQKVVARRTIFELEGAKRRAHILEGLKIALDNLDEVIETIKKSSDAEVAKQRLITKFKLSAIQAEAILELQLRRLAALERKKIEDEYKETCLLIERLADLLGHPEKIIAVVGDELKEIKKEYGDERRTKVVRQKLRQLSEEDLVSAEPCLIIATKTGYLKRLPFNTYRSQHRGGKGVVGMTTKEEDEIRQITSANTHDIILFFTDRGRVFAIRAWELPEGNRQAKGQAVINLIDIEDDEKIQSILNLPENGKDSQNKYLLMVTSKGTIKKTKIEEFKNIRTSGKIAIKLERDDSLCWVKPTTGDNQVLLVSHEGKSIRFPESNVRPMGRNTAGVRGILLKGNDFVVGMEVFPSRIEASTDKRSKPFRDILIITERGLGKRTSVMNHPLQKRGGIGVKAARITDKTGKIVACQMVDNRIFQVIITSRKAQVIKLPLKNIPKIGRDTQGVILMRFSKTDDRVAAVACIEQEEVR